MPQPPTYDADVNFPRATRFLRTSMVEALVEEGCCPDIAKQVASELIFAARDHVRVAPTAARLLAAGALDG